MSGMRHVAMVIEDLDRMFSFYHDLFGMDEVRRQPGRAIHISDGVFGLTFLKKRELTVEETRANREVDSAGKIGFNHFGFQVESLEETVRAVGELGQEPLPRNRPRDGRFVELRINDPEGNRVDLSKNGYGAPGRKTLPRVCHIRIRAKDPHHLADFYRRAFAMNLVLTQDGLVTVSDGEIGLIFPNLSTNHGPGVESLGIQVKNLNAFYANLMNYDPTVETVFDSHNPESLKVIDPAGNILELVERDGNV